MKRLLASAALALSALLAIAQVPATLFTGSVPLLSAVSTTGAGAAVRAPNTSKSYQVTSSVATGTGTAVVSVQGANDSANWDTIGTMSVSLTTTSTSASFTSLDKYVWLRGNVTTLSGSTPTLSLTAGY